MYSCDGNAEFSVFNYSINLKTPTDLKRLNSRVNPLTA